MTTTNYTPAAQAQLINIGYVCFSFSLLGGIGGAIYSHKTGGGGWRGVGYFFLGSIAVGAIAHLISLPAVNKIIANGTVTTDTSSFQELGQLQALAELERVNAENQAV